MMITQSDQAINSRLPGALPAQARPMNRRSRYARTRLLVTLVLSLFGCSKEGNQEIVARVPSPDGIAEAYVVRYSGPATVPFSDVVYVVGHGAPVPSPDQANFVAENTKGLSAKWAGPKVLDIAFDSARITRFSNFDNHLQGGTYLVELRLRPRGDHSF